MFKPKFMWSKSQLEKWYLEEELSAPEIAERMGASPCRVWEKLRDFNIPRRSQRDCKLNAIKRGRLIPTSPMGSQSKGWKGGRRKDRKGYIWIYNPRHPRANKNRCVAEHILIWENIHNKKLPKGWVIHHLNGIKDDNRPENLVALPNLKHIHLLVAKAQRIRELEAEVKFLEKTLDSQQMIWWTEN